jgi:Icc-related predicted phosphoesterase
MAATVVRVAAVGDLHCTKTSQGGFQPWLSRIAEQADVLLLPGDLTDYGLPEEARILAKELASVRVPMVGVLGNHDVESGKEDEVSQILTDAGVIMLNGDACEVAGIGIAGIKGFGGGFGTRALGPWGETIIKQFVREAVDEALKLEAALARLRTERLIALLHYSPVVQTVEGEPLEIYPFLGSSRLEEPIGRYPVSLVVHGHAHRGQLQGATKTGIPVYNVSMPLLLRTFADRPPFRVFEVRSARRRRRVARPPLN